MIEPVCYCNHDKRLHKRGGKHCNGIDSYGCPCECPSFDERKDDD